MRARIIIGLVIVLVVAVVGGAVALWRLNVAAAAPPAPRETPVPTRRPTLESLGARDEVRADGWNEKAKLPDAPRLLNRNGVDRVSCTFACGVEDRCGFRDADVCEAASCDGDVRTTSRMDYCVVDADDCLAVAACGCEEACWKRGECTRDHGKDGECERACLTLVKQQATERYREDRCVLERRCEAIASCGGAVAPAPY